MVKTNKKPWIFIFLCSLAYFASYITRQSYSAAIVALVPDLNTTEELAGIGVAGSFITYGAGMFLSGWLGDKMPARRLIAIGLFGSCLTNLIVSSTGSIYVIAVLWCFNGLFQAMVYPPLMRLMGDNLSNRHLVTGITMVTMAANFATVLLYATFPVLINWSGWRLAIFAAAAIGTLSTVTFLLGTRNCQVTAPRKTIEERSAPIGKIILRSGIIPLFFAIVIMGMLRDGIQTWMPTYVNEVVGLGESSSILTAVILPILSIFSIAATKMLFIKVRNEVKAAFLTYLTGTVSAVLLVFTFRSAPFFGVAMVALINACMHGTNLLLISLVPAQFKKFGKISTFSGLMNAFVYIGSAISSYGIPALSGTLKNGGWSTIITLWAVLAAVGTTICLLRIPKWKRFCQED